MLRIMKKHMLANTQTFILVRLKEHIHRIMKRIM